MSNMNVRIVYYSVFFSFITLIGCFETEKEETSVMQLDAAEMIENLNLEPHYFFEPVHLTKVMALEDSLGAKSKDLGKPRPKQQNHSVPTVRYERPRIGLLRPKILYIYSEPDSLVRYIEYIFVADAEDSTRNALAAQHYFAPDSGLYAVLKDKFMQELGQPSEPEVVQHIRQKPAGLVEMRLIVWQEKKTAITLQVVESQSASVKISFRS